MKQEFYQQVALIGLRNKDGSMMLNVPLYVKVSEVNKSGLTDSEEELMHRISAVMIRRYESQINEYMASLKKKQCAGARQYENDAVRNSLVQNGAHTPESGPSEQSPE